MNNTDKLRESLQKIESLIQQLKKGEVSMENLSRDQKIKNALQKQGKEGSPYASPRKRGNEIPNNMRPGVPQRKIPDIEPTEVNNVVYVNFGKATKLIVDHQTGKISTTYPKPEEPVWLTIE